MLNYSLRNVHIEALNLSEKSSAICLPEVQSAGWKEIENTPHINLSFSFAARLSHNTKGLQQTLTENPNAYVCFSTMENRRLNRKTV